MGASSRPEVIARFAWTTMILGANQGTVGWCTLILNKHVEHLDALSIQDQGAIFMEVARAARAIRQVFAADKGGNGGSGEGRGGGVRINYECLGNVVPHVHWHLIPRHADDPTPRATVWGWSEAQLAGQMGQAEREALIKRLQRALQELA